jgi:hypothetical protein
MQKAHYHIVFFSFSIALLFLLQNCQTPEPEVEETVTLERGEWFKSPEPYPAYQAVREVHTHKDGSRTSRLRYQLWDMDRDGQPDLLREVDEKGNAIFTAYDFNLPE